MTALTNVQRQAAFRRRGRQVVVVLKSPAACAALDALTATHGSQRAAIVSFYAETFKKLQPSHDPRHIEAFVRLEYSTLNHLDMRTLRREAKIAAECIEVGGIEQAELCAVSFGL